MKKINIFILAAGLGKRLRPITNHIPKPLLPVLGRTVIEYVLDNMGNLPVDKIGINLHYKKEIVQAWAMQSERKDRITTFPEDVLLGTGGALKNAEGFLREQTFLVHNSDILSDIDLEQLRAHHLSSGNLVTLAIHNFPKFNNLIVDTRGLLKGLSSECVSDVLERRAFTGIAVYEPEFLQMLPDGASSVVDTWLDAVSAGHGIGTFDVTGCSWTDIGTPTAYAAAVFDALRKAGEVIFVHRTIHDCGDVDLKGHVVIEEGAVLNQGVSLKNCILLSGGDAGAMYESSGQHEGAVENCILGPDFTIDLHEADILDLNGEGGQLIGTGGSERRYYRLRGENKSVVLMQCKSDDPDFERHMEYSEFFLNYSIQVPALIRRISGNMQALFEDAGDLSLYSYLRCPRECSDIEGIYRKVIDLLVLFHARATDHVSECPLLKSRVFDYDLFRWETGYFIERFVGGVRGIQPDNNPGLEKEFHAIAVSAGTFPKTIIHRDFQSQNIMIMKDRELRVLDFQGARMGPPAYDVASMLWDPYFRIEDSLRNDLVDYYIERMKDVAEGRFDEDSFRDSLVLCRLQRHMQALGAYGFLSNVKGKKYFMKYIPEALRLLKEDISGAGDDYPELYGLIMKL